MKSAARTPGWRRWWRKVGPGLITGASDDDPSGLATYSQSGAGYGVQLAWTLVLTFPLMYAVQAISARIGRVTGNGIAGNLRKYYPNWLLQAVVMLLFVANAINLGADLAVMAEAARLLWKGLPEWVLVLAFAALCTTMQVLLPHERYVNILKWLTLSLFTYIAVLFVIHVPWGALALGMLIPRVAMDRDAWMMVVAILGTTISPYLFFWQAGQEVEDTKAARLRQPLRIRPAQGPSALARIHMDTLIGMALSNVVALAVMVTAAATLHAGGAVRDIQTAAQAAEALRPLAGDFAFAAFALGIVGTGLLAVPVLAGSAAYALGEARGWPVGFSRAPRAAKAFYAAIAAATLLGVVSTYFSVGAIRMLVAAAVINGIVAAPVMILLMWMSADRRIMGRFPISMPLKVLGWSATVLMVLAALVFAILSLQGLPDR